MHLQEVLLTSRIADLQLTHFSRLALFQFLHQNIIAGIEIMRVGWHQKARLKHHLKEGRGPAFPSNNGNKDKVNELLEVKGKHYGNTYII